MPRKGAYTVVFKLKAVEIAEKSSKGAAAREVNVDPKRIREWCSQKDKLLAMKKEGKSRRKRLKGGGRKALDEEMEEQLFDWILEMRGRNLRVSRRMIQDKARELVTTMERFVASRGWLDLFMKRHGLSLRRKTTVCQSTPTDYIPKIVSFICHLCWMEMPSDTTVHCSGSRSVSVKTTGHEKDHFTVILTAKADGTKMKSYVVFKGKGTRLIKELSKIPGIVVRLLSYCGCSTC